MHALHVTHIYTSISTRRNKEGAQGHAIILGSPLGPLVEISMLVIAYSASHSQVGWAWIRTGDERWKNVCVGMHECACTCMCVCVCNIPLPTSMYGNSEMYRAYIHAYHTHYIHVHSVYLYTSHVHMCIQIHMYLHFMLCRTSTGWSK